MKRVDPSVQTKIRVWAKSAGRCVICNNVAHSNEGMGEVVPVGEVAHAVGATDGANSPRGQSDLSANDRALEDNLLLLCLACHESVDDRNTREKYTVEDLLTLKREHESWVEFVTKIDPGRTATVIRVLGQIRGTVPSLSWDEVSRTIFGDLLLPEKLVGHHRDGVEINLAHSPDTVSKYYFQHSADLIESAAREVNLGIRSGEISRIAVFAFARIPLLVKLGASLDDKVNTLIYQRRRVDGGDAWRWDVESGTPTLFAISRIDDAEEKDSVAVVFNLSGTVNPADIEEITGSNTVVYEISPEDKSLRGPQVVDSRATLAEFQSTWRRLLAQIEERHPEARAISIFPAIPISAAFEIGRALMPHVSPTLKVYDRDDSGKFIMALEVEK